MLISSFAGEYEFLSNFYPSLVFLDGILYPTVEHAFQASKTLNKDERIIIISSLRTPGKAKRAGRLLDLRPDWDEVKLDIMRQCIFKKFLHPELQGLLMNTYPHVLIEGNNWGDRFWGAEMVNGNWVGENHLGRILMEMRSELLITNP